MGKCVSCNTKIGRQLKSCPNCDLWNFENKYFNKIQIPEELKTELVKSHKIISDELTRENLEKFVEEASVQLNFPINTLKITIISESKNLVQTGCSPTVNDVVMDFVPRMWKIFSEEESMAIARHELLHPITLKRNFTRYDDPIFDTFWHAYAELINHLEHFKRIKDDLHYHSAKEKSISESVFGLFVIRSFAEINEQLLSNLKLNLFLFFEHTIYFFHKNNNILKKFLEKYEFQKIWEFFGWLNEDLLFISSKIQVEDCKDYLLYLFVLANIVDQEVLVKENKIKHASSWLGHPVESIQAFFEQTIFTDEDDEIKFQIRNNWKSRLLN